MNGFAQSIAVTIGINDYRSGIPSLTTAKHDASTFAELFRNRFTFDVVIAPEDDDSEATGDWLKHLLTVDLPKRVGRDDRLVFYFAGHGMALDGDDGPAGYLVPQDASRADRSSLLRMHDVHQWLTALPCRHALIVLDCCFAGAFRWSGTRTLSAGPEVLHRERYERYLKDDAWLVLTSAAYNEEALDVAVGAVERPLGRRDTDESAEHSPFASRLLRGLAGEADILPAACNGQSAGDGIITAHELFAWLQAEFTASDELSQTPMLWALPQRHQKGEFVFVAPDRQPLQELPPAPALDESTNPWRWPHGYRETEEDAELLFGRGHFIDDLQNRVEITDPLARPEAADSFDRHALTVVTGPSGSGKSSVVRAGLIVRLKQSQEEPEVLRCHVCPVIRPSASPLAALDGLKLNNLDRPEALSAQIDNWFRSNDADRLVIVIDQFEELLTQCQDETERTRFCKQLDEALDQHGSRLRVVVTLRSDFEPLIRGLVSPKRWATSVIAVPPMTHDELRQVIEEPASARVLYFDPPKFVDRLIRDVLRTPGALPLLSFALTELYRRNLERYRKGLSDNRFLLESDYDVLGGVSGVLQNRADSELNELAERNDGTDTMMRNALLRMVTVRGGRAARRRVPRHEFTFRTATAERQKDEVLQRLQEAMLIVTDQEPDTTPIVEPAHDELVLGWPTFQEWLNTPEFSEQIRLRESIAPAVAAWTPRDGGVLWSHRDLKSLRKIQLADGSWLNEVESKAVTASVRKRRTVTISGAVTVGATLVLLALFVITRQQSLQNEALSQQNAALSLLVSATGHSGEGRVNHAISLAAHSLTKHDHLDARRLLVETPGCSLFRKFNVSESSIDCLTFAPTGRTLFAGLNDGSVVSLDLKTGGAGELGTHDGWVDALQISQDGTRLVTSNFGRELFLWNLDAEAPIKQQLDLRHATSEEESHIFDPVFTPDGQFVLAALPGQSGNELAGVWDARDGTPLPSLKSIPESPFSPDGTRFVTNAKEGVALFDVASRTVSPGWEPARSAAPLAGGSGDQPAVWAFSDDGARLAAGSLPGSTVWILDATSMDRPLQLAETLSMRRYARGIPSHDVTGVAYDVTGQWLIGASSLNTLVIWNADFGNIRNVIQVPAELDIESFAVSPATTLVAAGCSDGTVYVWDFSGFPARTEAELWHFTETDELFPYPGRDALGTIESTTEAEVAVFEHDGRSLLVGLHDGSVRRYDVNTGQLQVMRPTDLNEWEQQGHNGRVRAIGAAGRATGAIFSVSPSDIYLRDRSDLSVIKRIDQEDELLSDDVVTVGMTPDGARLGLSLLDGMVRIVDCQTDALSLVDEFDSKTSGTHDDLTLFGDGRWAILTSGYSNEAVVRNIDAQTTHRFTIPGLDEQEGIRVLAARPREDSFVSPSPSGALVEWTFEPARGLVRKRELDNGSWPLKFSPDGRWLAFAADNDSIGICDMEAGQRAATLRYHTSQLEGLVFSPDSRRLASFAMDNTLCVHDLSPLQDDVETIIARTESLTGLTISGQEAVELDQPPTTSAERNLLEKRVWQRIEAFNQRRNKALGNRTWAEWWAEQYPHGAQALATLRITPVDNSQPR